MGNIISGGSSVSRSTPILSCIALALKARDKHVRRARLNGRCQVFLSPSELNVKAIRFPGWSAGRQKSTAPLATRERKLAKSVHSGDQSAFCELMIKARKAASLPQRKLADRLHKPQ